MIGPHRFAILLLFSLRSDVFEPSQNSRIARIARMQIHKGTFSNLYIWGVFSLFERFISNPSYSCYSAILTLFHPEITIALERT